MDFPSPREERELDSSQNQPRSDEAEKARLEAALSCGPQCASSVLATRYAKILRQERLLALAASALEHLEGALQTWSASAETAARIERSKAIRKEIDDERGNPA